MTVSFRPRLNAAFTLIELLLVMFIMLLLTMMAVPMLSQFSKSSKVQQTASVVSSILSRARMEAMRTRQMIGVFFGDDVSRLNPQPQPGIIPIKNHIEMWTLKTNGGSNGIDGSEGPIFDPNPTVGAPAWYPYTDPDANLTGEPITWPDGVRILSGYFILMPGNPPQCAFGCALFNGNPTYNRSAYGEIKRHEICYTRSGAMPNWYDGLNTYWSILIFDEQTGEHAVIWAGAWLITAKPRILPFTVKNIIDLNGVTHPLTNNMDIPKYIDM